MDTILTEHLAIFFLPGLVGILAGSLCGYMLAIQIFSRLSPQSHLIRIVITLFPWRTVTFTLVLVLLTSPYTIRLMGPGLSAAQFSIGMTGFVFALASSIGIVMHDLFRPALIKQLISTGRTIMIALIALTVFTAEVGGGGAGLLITQATRNFDDRRLFGGYAVVVLLSLIADEILGIVQIFFLKRYTLSDYLTQHASTRPSDLH